MQSLHLLLQSCPVLLSTLWEGRKTCRAKQSLLLLQ